MKPYQLIKMLIKYKKKSKKELLHQFLILLVVTLLDMHQPPRL